jgi:hypothetical protein
VWTNALSITVLALAAVAGILGAALLLTSGAARLERWLAGRGRKRGSPDG